MTEARNAREETVLVLQGGGALGAYQAGVYEALDAHGVAVDWVAGISIGAINAAIIAGNPPEARVAKLKSFWFGVSEGGFDFPFFKSLQPRELVNELGAAMVASTGVPGFFTPRLIPPGFQSPDTLAALSIYDTTPLIATLNNHVDFDRIAAPDAVRLSVGAVDIESGNFDYFDSQGAGARPLDHRHIMASGALPPGFPPVDVDGRLYWDGGLVSNTPLDYVMGQGACESDAAIFQIDLFSATGPRPRVFTDVFEREKDIRYSSRTRLISTAAKTRCERGQALARLLERLPDALKDDPDARFLTDHPRWMGAVSLCHLIYRSKQFETQSKDYLFTRTAIEAHWQAGVTDAQATLAHPDWRARPRGKASFRVHDHGVRVND